MTPYTTEDLFRGIGAFDQAMLTQATIPGTSKIISAGAAIGILFAMIRSGLPGSKITQLLDTSFADNGPRLKQILAMYEGGTWDIHLWHLLLTDHYKLCTELCQRERPNWRYEASNSAVYW